jgi:IclR family transcriptional regulator, acetate operon repressor
MKLSADPPVKSALRTIDVLEFVAGTQPAPTFAEIAEALNIPNSSLFYLLNTLSKRGYLAQVREGGGYTLGKAVDALGARRGQLHSWRELAVPMLEELTKSLNETSAYAEPRGDEIETVAIKLATRSLLPVLRAGERFPLHLYSGGKLILASMSDEAVDAYIGRTKFERLTPNTIATAKALRKEVAEVRASGFGVSREENVIGVIGIAKALKTTNETVGTIGVVIATARYTPSIDAAVRRGLSSAADRFRAASGYTAI